jgi:two-component system nitrate/nitrite response regulator NarL
MERPSTTAPRLRASVIGSLLECALLNINWECTIMDYDVVYKEHALPLAQPSSSYVMTILICQNALIRSGISHILAGTQFVMSEEALEHAPEVPVLCLIHEDQAANKLTETVERLKVQWPSARVVLLTDHMDPIAVAQALRAGVAGLCSTAMNREVLIKAFELVMLGETFIPAALGLALLDQQNRGTQAGFSVAGAEAPANDFASVKTLSGREAQILHFLTQGASNKLIARDLGVAEATVKVHVKAILRKVKVANRTQAAMWAQQHLQLASSNQS